MRSDSTTVEEYLRDLPADRREIISAVRDLVVKNLPQGYVENINWGMISYEIPLSQYPDTYNGQPLSYLAIAAQKNHNALYMMGIYGNSEQLATLKKAYAQAGKKLKMGKACLRFTKLDDLEMEAIAGVIRETSVNDFIEQYERSRGRK